MIMFLTCDTKSYYISVVLFYFFTFYVALRPFPKVILCFPWWCKSGVISESSNSDDTFNVACELSQPLGKTEFSSTAKNRTNYVS